MSRRELRTHWNYRLVRHVGQFGDAGLMIHEAYYREGEEAPYMISHEGAPPSGDTAEEVADALERMRQALTLPVMEARDFRIVSSGAHAISRRAAVND